MRLAEGVAERAPEAESAVQPAGQKYEIEAPIGRGGMGEVFLATDRDLRRQVAMKLLRKRAAGGRIPFLHFMAEAQATSQLEHPGIPPVHDIGVTDEGRPWFTMKLVRGRTLREVLHDLLLKRREVQEQYNLHRLVSILERVAETLQFAHERGVIHRDIKPENIMLGDYGEVHLMDWGLARVESTSAEYEQVETARTESGLETRYGEIMGTPAYMSPEQSAGEPVDARTDLYALGCVLYEVLTLQPAFDPADNAVLLKVSEGQFEDVATRNPKRPVPEALASICRLAMQRDRDERRATAADFREALRAWLDGRSERERRHKESEELAGAGKKVASRCVALRDEIAETEGLAESEAANYEPHQSIAEKRPLIEAQKKIEQLKVDLALAFAEAQKLLGAALLQDEDNAGAKADLVWLWKARLADAELRRHKAHIAYAKAMIERYAGEPVVDEGQLFLESNPPAEVTIARYEEVDGVLTPTDEQSLGNTPVDVTLPAGSYLCVLKARGFRDTRYPVMIERARKWSGAVNLKADEQIGEEFVHVAAGPFLYGEGERAKTKRLKDFAIQRYPVTFEEYLEFLDTLDEDAAEARKPQTQADGPFVERDESGKWRVLEGLVQGPAREWSLEQYGEGFELRCPVTGISYDDAVAYCLWKTATTGMEWRIPTEEEREKAARGVDGRQFAWGDLMDASLGKCRDSRAVNAQPEPVGAFPTAESVYGMGDASGGVWDWTSSWEDERRRETRVLRGGSWRFLPTYLKCADRNSYLPQGRNAVVGIRCARTL
ncbi:MAG: protein kinase domain-containing protein [Planctomycetota bacterium]